MADVPVKGTIHRITEGELANEPICLQISKLDLRGNSKYNCSFSDGGASIDGVTASQVGKLVESGLVKDGGLVRLTEYACTLVGGSHKLIVTGCEPVVKAAVEEQKPSVPPAESSKAGPIASASGVLAPVANGDANAMQRAPSLQLPMPNGIAKENAGTYKTPVAKARPYGGIMTPGPTPPSTGRMRKAVQPIQALNPYNNNWTIRACVRSKGPKRSFSRNGSDVSVFSLELIDEQGTAIEATLWRELADAFYERLEEGKVYYFGRGKIKPANRAYSNVRNDYTISFDIGADIEESEDQDGSKMTARLSIVDIGVLASHVGKKAPVDMLGIVTQVGPLGSTKRKTDGTELSRRDITLIDASRKSVSLTLWGKHAEETGGALEGMESPIVSVSSVRVTDYNGVSVSSLSKSVVTINPDIEEAVRLRSWWDLEGRMADISPAGAELPSAIKAGSGPSRDERAMLVALKKQKDMLPAAEAKPEWHTVTATIANIDPTQTLYYTACPDNNRKLVPQGDAWLCEYDGKVYHAMVRRYVMQGKVMDASGELYLSFFNKEAEAVLGMSADELASLKVGEDETAFQEALKRAQWSEWTLHIQTRTQEYNGELRLRHSVQSASRVKFVSESKRIVEALRATKAVL